MPDLITTDIDNFWRAFDAADRLPTADRVKLFQASYFDVASRGMRDFMRLRLDDAEAFEAVVTRHDDYYRSSRSSMMRIREFEGEIRYFYKRFEALYPPLQIPNLTFVVGRLSCGGTTSESGLLVGAEMFAMTDRTPIDTLNHWHRAVIRPVSEIPSIVIHELVHIQQRSKGTDRHSLLAKSVREGMADFLTELVTRRKDDRAHHIYGRKHEEALWESFTEEMGETDAGNWLGNGVSSVDRPADLGYFIGCQICRAYVARFGETNETLQRMIEVEDFEEIYRDSGYSGISH